jgi:Subtilase family
MRRTAPASLLGLLAFGLAAASAQLAPDAAPKPRLSAGRLANADEVRKRLGLAPEYAHVRGIEAVKIAVLDYGFDGVGGARTYLPESAVVVEHYDADFVRRFNLGDPEYRRAFEPQNRHGRALAQIVWAVTGSNPQGPQFYLLNANGPTMLRRAVRYAIEQKVDVILFSGSFEGGGNGDGRGFVNRIVADALAAGIIWVNAAGNYGRRVYNGPVRIDPDGYLRFRDGAEGTVLRFRNRLDENAVTVTLTWNDYREEEDAGTSKDLDLFVEDWTGKRLGAGEKTQVTTQQVAGPEQSRNPRERVVLADLPANLDFNYRIRVLAKAGAFTQEDRIRVLITATRETYLTPASDVPDEAVKFFDATGRGELYPPADHPLVLTVGDSAPDSALGPTADHRLKPDVILEDSRAFFSDGQVTAGSSNAAAYFTGVVAVLKAAEPNLRTRHLLRLVRQGTAAPKSTAVVSTSQASPRAAELVPAPTKLRVTGPRGGTLDLQFGRTPRELTNGPVTTLRVPTLSTSPIRSPLAALREARPEVPAALEGRVWRTPSRPRLAEVLREGG